MSSTRASLLFTVAVAVFAAPAWGDEAPASAAGPAGPLGPADKYRPVTSGELFDTAQTLAKGQRQIRLSTRSHWGLTDSLQLDVGLLQSLGGPTGGLEYRVWSEGHSAASVAFQGQTAWNGSTRTGTALGQYTLGVGEWDRLNLQLGYGQGKVEVATGVGKEVAVTTWRTVPLKVSFDKVKSDRRVFRYNAAIDAGPLTNGGQLEAEGGVLWTYGFNSFRLSLGGGLRYAPSFGDQLNAALITAQQEPIDFPNVLPKLDANLWWTW
jgi:hypothetical protein